MAFSLARGLSSLSRRVVSAAVKDHRSFSSLNAATLRFTPGLCPTSTFHENLRVTITAANIGIRTSALHTEGDRRFVELLDEEISEEKKRLVATPGMSDGWEISLKGALGTLSKAHNGDIVEVSFTLNGSVPPLDDDEIEQQHQEEDGPIVSYPEFNVKVTKPGNGKTIEFECYFPRDVQEGMEDDSANLFSIRSAMVYEGELCDETFIIETENLDPDVYSFFISYLADRDVDQQFAQEFVNLATALEVEEYVKSLQKLKDFIASK